jgi:hypothetical protein
MGQGDGVPVPSTLKPAVGLHVGFKELELSLLREVTHLKTLQGYQIIQGQINLRNCTDCHQKTKTKAMMLTLKIRYKIDFFVKCNVIS